MKKLIIIILLFFGFITLNAQTYEKSMKVEDLGTWNKTVSPANKISVSSYVTKQKIVGDVSKNAVITQSKYRYELIVKSNSVYNGQPTKTWIFGTKVFVDGKEATISQSPDGFTAIINIEPTVIFRYDSNLDTINIKITWESSKYFQGK
jgi:hypothetical protein